MMEPNIVDELIAKSVGTHIQKDMQMVSRTFNTLIEKYSFLFNGDTLATQNMLIAACFPSTVPIMEKADGENSDGKVHFNMNQIIGSISEEMKGELYRRVMTEFATKIQIDDINGEKGDAK